MPKRHIYTDYAKVDSSETGVAWSKAQNKFLGDGETSNRSQNVKIGDADNKRFIKKERVTVFMPTVRWVNPAGQRFPNYWTGYMKNSAEFKALVEKYKTSDVGDKYLKALRTKPWYIKRKKTPGKKKNSWWENGGKPVLYVSFLAINMILIFMFVTYSSAARSSTYVPKGSPFTGSTKWSDYQRNVDLTNRLNGRGPGMPSKGQAMPRRGISPALARMEAEGLKYLRKTGPAHQTTGRAYKPKASNYYEGQQFKDEPEEEFQYAGSAVYDTPMPTAASGSRPRRPIIIIPRTEGFEPMSEAEEARGKRKPGNSHPGKKPKSSADIPEDEEKLAEAGDDEEADIT